jgi:putative membrane protein insertion efficiency factor
MSVAARVLLFAVRVYQSFFSALMPSACKFYPSCSHYGAEAVRVHGARRGSWLALRRIARCHPFTPGGVDLVPDAEDRQGISPQTDFSGARDFATGSEKAQTEVCATRFASEAAAEISLKHVTEEVRS